MPLKIRRSKKEERLIDARTRVEDIKRQKFESETYRRLREEYMELFNIDQVELLPPFVRNTNKTRMAKLEVQMTKLAAVSQVDDEPTGE